MIALKLSNGMVVLISNRDLAWARGFRWHCLRSTDTLFYAGANCRLAAGVWRLRSMHRLLLGLADPAVKVDHIDGNGLNNCRWNLRLATNQQNLANAGPMEGGTSRFKGVSWHKRAGRWQAHHYGGGRSRYLGLYYTEEGAALAYDRAARELFGEYARLNFPMSADAALFGEH